MTGLRNLGTDAVMRLLLWIGLVMVLFGLLVVPSGGAPVAMVLFWIGAELLLLAMFAVVASEAARRYFSDDHER